VWWNRPWRWFIWFWLPGLCLCLVFSSLPSVVMEFAHRHTTSCGRDNIWAVDAESSIVPDDGPSVPVKLGLQQIPGPVPVFVVPATLGPAPAILSLFANDVPRSHRQVTVICLTQSGGFRTVTCSCSVPGLKSQIQAACSAPLRGGLVQFEVRRVQRNGRVLPLRLSVSLQRNDGLTLGTAMILQ